MPVTGQPPEEPPAGSLNNSKDVLDASLTPKISKQLEQLDNTKDNLRPNTLPVKDLDNKYKYSPPEPKK